jgi:hypothetical protein
LSIVARPFTGGSLAVRTTEYSLRTFGRDLTLRRGD